MPKRLRPDKSQIKVQAEQAYKKQERKFKASASSDRESKLLNELQKKGTLSDKVSALMIKIQNSFTPEKFCDFQSLDVLMHMAKKKSRHHSYAAIEGLKELFTENLLPNRPLKYINDTEVNKIPGALSKLHLEDKLKHKYTEFINILKSHSLDTIDFYKKASVKVLGSLLIKPEMQDYILECIVNKLGDPNTAIPTSVVLECNHLVWKNKTLLEPLLKTISRFLSRPSLPPSSKFYSIVLLNSLKLSQADQVPLQILIQTLLRLFPIVLEETRSYGNKAVSLLLKALNKNFPLFSSKTAYKNFFKEEINEIYKLTHSSSTNVQIESLRFIFQSEQAQGYVSDRYYRALYEFILPTVGVRNITYKSQALLFNTLMVSLKEDSSISRVKAFIKRLLQLCLICEPPFILASLMLVSELIKVHKSITQLLEVPSEDEEENYRDIPDSDLEQASLDGGPEAVEPAKTKYDPFKREPKFCGAETAGLYELGVLTKHPHPTVSKWSIKIFEGQAIEYEGDPLLDFTLINFLDRFEYRNPKKKLLNNLQGKKIRMSLIQDAVNTKQFRDLENINVREEEMFFYKYFKLKPEKVVEEYSGSEENDDFDEIDNESIQDEFLNDDDDEALPVKKQRTSVFMDADEFYSK